jgi:hypothetical protein
MSWGMAHRRIGIGTMPGQDGSAVDKENRAHV